MRENNLSTLDEISLYRRGNPAAHLIIDTNILLLFFIGIFDSDYLKECPLMTDNGKNYCKEHFELMKKVLEIFLYKVTITPHVLSEINMLSRKRVKPEARMNGLFSKMIQQLERCEEEQVELKIILKNGGVLKFGFTDVSLIEVATKNNRWVILTDEFDLYKAYKERISIIYFSKVVASELYKASL
jgi:rRNA-processing protein FCF1